VTDLVNELAARSEPEPVVLLLDDYHLIQEPSIHRSVALLLERLPPRLRLVLAGRADPPLPLARLRARGQLTEVRQQDLRFTAEEAADLLEEVLDRQPEPLRGFVLTTSVLERLSGPLCDAVTGRDDSQRLLEQAERANLFLVPLDGHRRWWRYHHLFADLLRPPPGGRPRRDGTARRADRRRAGGGPGHRQEARGPRPRQARFGQPDPGCHPGAGAAAARVRRDPGRPGRGDSTLERHHRVMAGLRRVGSVQPSSQRRQGG
jgi:ATP/maltotriose-dependent transcriptional regulator MalT